VVFCFGMFYMYNSKELYGQGKVDKSFGFNLEKRNNSESRFHAIYFLDNLTGSLFLSNKYSTQSAFSSNGDLISGFLNALNLFIKEINPQENDDEIEEINFKETRILYERKGRLLVIAISKKTNVEIERTILRQIMEDFYGRYEKDISKFNGLIDPNILLYKKRLENKNLETLFLYNNLYKPR